VAEQRPFDLAEFFREFTTQWEREFDSLANRVMGTEDFSRSMNQMQRLQIGMQRAFTEFMGQQLASFNVASRDDVTRIGEALQAVDARLGRLENLLEQIGRKEGVIPHSGRVQGPPRSKRPPSHKKQSEPAAASEPQGEDKP
jgi:uncharacterized protein with von Willebrand factor type A (vWA) domain